MERRPIKTIRNQVYQILKDDICEGRLLPASGCRKTSWQSACA